MGNTRSTGAVKSYFSKNKRRLALDSLVVVRTQQLDPPAASIAAPPAKVCTSKSYMPA